ncbi:hypothetical protein [Streptomyces chrestomyceticus]|uniref:hypothetical protein n=1 Tax=Streptomyces chrestomyceticus TaxID=68185 RepID=UPI0033F024CF
MPDPPDEEVADLVGALRTDAGPPEEDEDSRPGHREAARQMAEHLAIKLRNKTN